MAVVVVECALLASLCHPAIIIVWHSNPGIQKVHDTVIESIVLSSNSCHTGERFLLSESVSDSSLSIE